MPCSYLRIHSIYTDQSETSKLQECVLSQWTLQCPDPVNLMDVLPWYFDKGMDIMYIVLDLWPCTEFVAFSGHEDQLKVNCSFLGFLICSVGISSLFILAFLAVLSWMQIASIFYEAVISTNSPC